MLKILIVDDEKIVRVALRTIVNWQEHGFHIVGTAGDGNDALAAVDKYRPDIVITDLKMPNMDGLQLIKTLKERNFDGKILVLSNYGEFDMVKQALLLGAVDYILKVTMKTDEFIAQLKAIGERISSERELKDRALKEKIDYNENRAAVKNNFLKELFTEDVFDYSKTVQAAARLGLQSALPRSFMYYICIDEYENSLQNSKINDRKLLVFSIKNIICEALNGVPNLDVVELNYKALLVLIPVQDFKVLESDRKMMAEKISSLLGMYLNIKVSLVTSGEFEGYTEARSKFADCGRAMNLKFYRGCGSIIDTGAVKTAKTAWMMNYEDEVHRIVPMLGCGKTGDIIAHVSGIVHDAGKENYPAAEFKKDFIRLLDSMEMQVPGLSPERDPVRENFKEKLFLSETSEVFLGILSDLMDYTGSQLTAKMPKRVRKEVSCIMEYIKSNIEKKISLSMLAEHVNMNESYLCRMFKSETGKSIVNYINEVKMEYAAQLLRNSDMPVKSIAYRVGIDDQFYFNRVFKKQFGVNPSEFKQKRESNPGRR